MVKMTLLTFCFVSLGNIMENKNYNRFQATMHLFNNFSQKTPKFHKNICEKNLAVAL